MNAKAVFLTLGKGYIKKVNVNDIIFIEADSCYSKIHTIGEQHFISKTLKELHEKIDSQLFYRISRSIIINLNYLDFIKGAQLYLTNGKSFIIPRRKTRKIVNEISQVLLL